MRSDISKSIWKLFFLLEKHQPGICKALYEQFGIAQFGRYPFQLLVTQMEQSEDIELPHAVMLFPRYDWNGTFFKNRVFERLYKDVGDKLRLCIFEADGRTGVMRVAAKSHQRYPKKILLG